MSKQITYCFHIHNFASACAKDPWLAVHLEEEAVTLGAFPARVDAPSETYCIFVDKIPIDEKQFIQAVLAMLKKYGLTAQQNPAANIR